MPGVGFKHEPPPSSCARMRRGCQRSRDDPRAACTTSRPHEQRGSLCSVAVPPFEIVGIRRGGRAITRCSFVRWLWDVCVMVEEAAQSFGGAIAPSSRSSGGHDTFASSGRPRGQGRRRRSRNHLRPGTTRIGSAIVSAKLARGTGAPVDGPRASSPRCRRRRSVAGACCRAGVRRRAQRPPPSSWVCTACVLTRFAEPAPGPCAGS